jgi:Protein of Unknown function (DUF2784)
MSDLCYIVVVVVAAVQFAFIGYIVIGGFLAVRWPRTSWLHMPAVVWVVGFALNLRCPLTELKRWARDRAGMSPLSPEGFIEHYITGPWYPAGGRHRAGPRVLDGLRVLGSLCGDRGKGVEWPK